MDTPLIFFAFANDTDDHLALLKEESRNVFDALKEADRKQYIKVYREESADVKDIFQGFTDYKNQISIFHYGGHASGTHLRLEDTDGDARGLAQLMGEQSRLKLVFLNGCSTLDQVETLMSAGVKAIIATSVPIQDRKATEFARQFYESLANRRTIGQAFHLAEAFLKAKYGHANDVAIISFRSIERKKPNKKVETIPWGLYIKDEHKEEILNWKLPYYRPIGLPRDMITYIGQSFSANRYIMLVLDEMTRYNPDIYAQMIEQRGEETVKRDSKYYPEIIIRNFPWPIGSQVRLLRVYDSPTLERLEHLISTYVVTGQLLYYILISDLWENGRHKKLDLTKTKRFRTGFPLSKEQYIAFDFWGQIPKGWQVFIDQRVAPFVPEYEMLVEEWAREDSPMRKAHNYLEELRALLLSDPPTTDMEKHCLRAEQAVAIMLKKAAFLARYRMLTVRNISIEQPRLRELTYELDMGPLNALEDHGLGMYQDPSHRRKKSYANSQSIVLTVDEDHLDDSLNLSPFVVDKHTFVQAINGTKTDKDKLANIYMLAWEEENRLYYLFVDHRIYLAIKTEQHQIHTDIRASAFEDGKQLGGTPASNDAVDEDPFGDDPFANNEPGEDDSPKVFKLLKEEFEAFVVDTSVGVR